MKVTLWILAVLLFSVFLAGCYTMLQHPRMEPAEEGHYARRHCSDCHGSADYYYYHYPYFYDWYWREPYWRSYYCDPWWYNDYWYWRDDGGQPVEKGERHIWQPRGSTESEPGLAPGTEIKTKEDRGSTPSLPDRQDTRQQEVKQTRKRLWEPRKPPEKPKQEPNKQEPNKSREKTKEKE